MTDYSSHRTQDDFQSMDLHDTSSWMSDSTIHISVLRVIGGWIYTLTDMESTNPRVLMNSVFVPSHEEELL